MVGRVAEKRIFKRQNWAYKLESFCFLLSGTLPFLFARIPSTAARMKTGILVAMFRLVTSEQMSTDLD
jgi:hypothetical protein